MFKQISIFLLCAATPCSAMRMFISPSAHSTSFEKFISSPENIALLLPYLNSSDGASLMAVNRFCARQLKNFAAPGKMVSQTNHELLMLEENTEKQGFFYVFGRAREGSDFDSVMQYLFRNVGSKEGVKKALELYKNKKSSEKTVFFDCHLFFSTLRCQQKELLQETEFPLFGDISLLRDRRFWPQIIGLQLDVEPKEGFLEEVKRLLTAFKEKEKRQITLFLGSPYKGMQMNSKRISGPDKSSDRRAKILLGILEIVRTLDLGPVRSLNLNNISTQMFSEFLNPLVKQQLQNHLVEFLSQNSEDSFFPIVESFPNLERLQLRDMTCLPKIKNVNFLQLKKLSFYEERVYSCIEMKQLYEFFLSLPKEVAASLSKLLPRKIDFSGTLYFDTNMMPYLPHFLGHFTEINSPFSLSPVLQTPQRVGSVRFRVNSLDMPHEDLIQILQGCSRNIELGIDDAYFDLDSEPPRIFRQLLNLLPRRTKVLSLSIDPAVIEDTIYALKKLTSLEQLRIILKQSEDGATHYKMEDLKRLISVVKNVARKNFFLDTEWLEKYIDDSGALADVYQETLVNLLIPDQTIFSQSSYVRIGNKYLEKLERKDVKKSKAKSRFGIIRLWLDHKEDGPEDSIW